MQPSIQAEYINIIIVHSRNIFVSAHFTVLFRDASSSMVTGFFNFFISSFPLKGASEDVGGLVGKAPTFALQK